MKLAAYVRVSTDRQAEEGLGLDVQRAAVETWAKENGHKVTLWAADEDVSGANGLDQREGLLDALEALKAEPAAGLVVYRLDRFARDLMVQEMVLSELRRLGVEVFSTSPGEAAYLSDEPDDPSRKFIRQVLGAVAEYERAMIALRLRSGRRAKAERGGFAYGSPPFGYRAEGGELVPDEGEQAVIARIAQLRHDGASLHKIAETLTTDGYPPRRSARWHVESVRRIVSRMGRS